MLENSHGKFEEMSQEKITPDSVYVCFYVLIFVFTISVEKNKVIDVNVCLIDIHRQIYSTKADP